MSLNFPQIMCEKRCAARCANCQRNCSSFAVDQIAFRNGISVRDAKTLNLDEAASTFRPRDQA